MAQENIFPEFARMLQRPAKEERLRQRSRVFWLYGLSGSGKSTLANALERRLFADGYFTQILDGDNIRTGLNRDLGFSDEDRMENIRRIAEVARLFMDAGVVTLTSFICPARAMRAMAREIVGAENFVEVYVRASFEKCAERDVKGLYAKAQSGELKQFTGKDSAFEEPERADLTIDTETATLEESLDELYRNVVPRIALTLS